MNFPSLTHRIVKFKFFHDPKFTKLCYFAFFWLSAFSDIKNASVYPSFPWNWIIPLSFMNKDQRKNMLFIMCATSLCFLFININIKLINNVASNNCCHIILIYYYIHVKRNFKMIRGINDLHAVIKQDAVYFFIQGVHKKWSQL